MVECFPLFALYPTFTLPIQFNMVKKHRLSSEGAFDYCITGIASQLKDYRLCLFINQALGLKLIRKGEIPVNSFRSHAIQYFPFYAHYDDVYRLNWYLIPNKNHLNQVMLADLKMLDFFLISEGLPAHLEIEFFISILKEINHVQMAQEMDLSQSKSFPGLLEDIELYNLELNKNKAEPIKKATKKPGI